MPLKKISGSAIIDVTVLVRIIVRARAPSRTKRMRASKGRSANGARAIRFAKKCAKLTGNLGVSQDCVNSGSVDIPAHTARVAVTYRTQARFRAQTHASVADIRIDTATEP